MADPISIKDADSSLKLTDVLTSWSFKVLQIHILKYIDDLRKIWTSTLQNLALDGFFFFKSQILSYLIAL